VSKITAILLSAVLIAALLPTQGCMKCADSLAKKATEKAVETALEKSTGGKVDLGTGSNVDLSGLPAELIYPNAKPLARWSITQDKSTGASYTFESTDLVATVVAHFKTSMAGWKNSSTMEANDATMLTYQNADESKSALIVIAPKKEGAGGTTVNVTYTTTTK
jgi:hypothetical protein